MKKIFKVQKGNIVYGIKIDCTDNFYWIINTETSRIIRTVCIFSNGDTFLTIGENDSREANTPLSKALAQAVVNEVRRMIF